MHAHATSVRVEQNRVFALLVTAGRPLTPSDIAAQLNAAASPTEPLVFPLEVESTLAALLLRPELHRIITARVRRATLAERIARRTLPFGALSGLVILAACTTLPPGTAPALKPSPVAAASYFGHAPTPKLVFDDTHPLFKPPMVALSCLDVPCLNEPPPGDLLAVKTPADVPASVLAYFADGDDRVYPPRAETAHAAVAPPPEASVLAAAQPDDALSKVSSSAPPISLASALPDTTPAKRFQLDAKAHPFGEQPTTRIRFSSAATMQPAQAPRTASQTQAVPTAQAITELIGFANNSDILETSSLARMQPLLDAARLADNIQLRGRVGYAVLTDAQRRLAVGRAIAVRRALVELGVDRSKIKILIPRDHDFVDAADPAAPVNRSVSVAITLSPEKAALLRQARGDKIASS